MQQPKISIIIPVYNVEKYLKRCVDSLTNQTLKDIEIILVDDESTDSSPIICDELAKLDGRIKVIHKKNEGAGLSRNVALKIAEGEYIGFVDSDDFVAEDMFESLLNTAEKYGSDLVLSNVRFVDGNMFSEKGECALKEYFLQDTHFETAEQLKELRMGIVGAKPGEPDDSKYGMSIWKNLFKSSVIKENNLWFQSEREMLSEDALFMIDYISCIKKATGVKGAFYNYCRNGESISKSYKKDRFEKSLRFVSEVEKRFEDIAKKDYKIYIYRFWQAMCRVLCSQEIMHAMEIGVSYADLKDRLKSICTHELTRESLKAYPISSLPVKQKLFAYAMKYKMYRVLKILVGLRSR